MATNLHSFRINKKGVSLIYVILVMLVMTILAVAVFTLFSSNLTSAKHQQQSIKAHFLAVSGIEMGYAALLDTSEGNRLLDAHFKANKPNDLSSVSCLNDTVSLDKGEVDILIRSYIDDSDERYIKIISKGRPSDGVNKTLSMYFNAKYPQVLSWDDWDDWEANYEVCY